jgi:hypothetical protein
MESPARGCRHVAPSSMHCFLIAMLPCFEWTRVTVNLTTVVTAQRSCFVISLACAAYPLLSSSCGLHFYCIFFVNLCWAFLTFKRVPNSYGAANCARWVRPYVRTHGTREPLDGSSRNSMLQDFYKTIQVIFTFFNDDFTRRPTCISDAALATHLSQKKAFRMKK